RERRLGQRQAGDHQPRLDPDHQQRPRPDRCGGPVGAVQRGGAAQVSTAGTGTDAGAGAEAGASEAGASEAGAGPEAAPGAGPSGPPGPPGPAITTSGLTKRFRGGQLAVDDLGLDVPRGSIYGFLGPNGSGKTTTIRMLLGLVYPTRGSVSLLGEPVPGAAARVLPRVVSLVEGPAFYPFLSGRANLARMDAADRTADPR